MSSRDRDQSVGVTRRVVQVAVFPFRLVGGALRMVTFPVRAVGRVRSRRRTNKAEKAARRAGDAFGRMSSFDQEQVRRTRARFE